MQPFGSRKAALALLLLLGWGIGQRVSQPQPLAPAAPLTGAAIAGTQLTLQHGQGPRQHLKITAVDVDSQAGNGDVYLYTVLVQTPQTRRWENLCQPDAAGAAQAIPLRGEWDAAGNYIESDRITLACTSGVLAKCVRWGYKPWKTVDGQSLQPYHQACTRMARADYCGNGISHTRDGTLIEVYDRLRIQDREPIAGASFEAAWGPQGAVMLSHTRYPEGRDQLQRECPEQLARIQAPPPADPIALWSTRPDALIINHSYP